MAKKRRELPPSNQGVEMEGRETWQVGLIRFDFHLHPLLPLPRTLSRLAVSLITLLNLKIDGGLFDFLLSRRTQRENSSLAGRQAWQNVEVQPVTRRRQVQPLITLFTQHQRC